MRILANYSCKSNGNGYSVTFETLGDVPREQADSTVDELFSLAKEAVKRQIFNGAEQQKETLVEDEEAPSRVLNRKPKQKNNLRRIKDPDAPATEKQIRLIERLSQIKGIELNVDPPSLTKAEASETIDQLLSV